MIWLIVNLVWLYINFLLLVVGMVINLIRNNLNICIILLFIYCYIKVVVKIILIWYNFEGVLWDGGRGGNFGRLCVWE